VAETLEDRVYLHGADLFDNYLPELTHQFRSGTYLTGTSNADARTIATNYLVAHANEYGLSASDITSAILTDRYTSAQTGITHLYFRQTHNGLPIEGADLNVNVTSNGRIINVGSRFMGSLSTNTLGQDIATAMPAVNVLQKAADALGIQITVTAETRSQLMDLAQTTVFAAPNLSSDDIPVKLYYVPTGAGQVQLAWNLRVKTLDGQHWVDLGIDAKNGSVVFANDWVSHAGYQVFASPLGSPLDGGRTIVSDPHDPIASPFGWHDTNGIPGPEFFDTRGNNVFAQEDFDGDSQGGTRPDGGPGLSFLFPFNDAIDPFFSVDAAITNLFYWNNILHDVHFRYGFDEASGNFQQTNYSGQGLGNDAVRADAQDWFAFFNAFMFTPPDGFQPEMAMGLWYFTFVGRDSDFANDVIIHEYGHGVTNRLTGGPSNANALDALQSGGMGEGWGDFWSLMLTQTAADTKAAAYPVGNYMMGFPSGGPGIRRYPYSFDMNINPLTYGDYNSSNEVHDSGEIWASALWDMNWLLIDRYGYNPTISGGYTGPGSAGNVLTLQLVMDALKLQPANPSFLDGRDAILLADQVLTGGANQDLIWQAFARRGMGFSASDGGSADALTVSEAFDLPNGLQINDVTQVEGETGNTIFLFNVSLTAPATTIVTVTVSTKDGTATAGLDYEAATQVLTFNPGETSKTFSVNVIGEDVLERDELFYVDLSAAVGATIFRSRGLGTITDDDNLAPVANNDETQTAIDVPVVINLIANDTDPNSPLDNVDPGSVTIVNNPSFGSLFKVPGTGAVVYTPNPGFAGTDTFTYTVTDTFGKLSNLATVQVKVLRPPTATNDRSSTAVSAPVDIAVLANDFDLDSPIDVTTVQVLSGPTFGTAIPQANGQIRYTPNAGYAGGDLFTYVVRDTDGLVSNVATVLMRVGAAVSLQGSVYIDFNQNDRRDGSEAGIPGALVRLEKTDGPVTFQRMVKTDASGNFSLNEANSPDLILPQGVYSIIELHPTIFVDGDERAGTIRPLSNTNDAFMNMTIPAGTNATGYEFGELGLHAGFMSMFLPLGVLASMEFETTALDASQLYANLNLGGTSKVVALNVTSNGLTDIVANYQGGGTVTLSLLNQNLQPVASVTSTSGNPSVKLSQAMAAGQSYVLVATGTASNVNLRIEQDQESNESPVAVNQPPVFSTVGVQTIQHVQTLELTMQATDPEGGKVSYLLGAGAPEGASIEAKTGLLRYSGAANHLGMVIIPVVAIDDGTPTGMATTYVVVKILRPGPVASLSGPNSVNIGDVGRFVLGAATGTGTANTSYMYRVDWDGDGSVDETFVGPNGMVVEHRFNTAGVAQVRVTAAGSDGVIGTQASRLVMVLPAASTEDPDAVGGSPVLTNLARPLDVNGDGSITALDALLIINRLNRATGGLPQGTVFFDTSGDGLVTPLDVLLIFNNLNTRAMQAAAAAAASSAAGMSQTSGFSSVPTSTSPAPAPAETPAQAADAVLEAESPAVTTPSIHDVDFLAWSALGGDDAPTIAEDDPATDELFGSGLLGWFN
jgi:hypothetical protein